MNSATDPRFLVVGWTCRAIASRRTKMMQYSTARRGSIRPAVLRAAGEEYVPGVGPIQSGTSHLDPKEDRYRTRPAC